MALGGAGQGDDLDQDRRRPSQADSPVAADETDPSLVGRKRVEEELDRSIIPQVEVHHQVWAGGDSGDADLAAAASSRPDTTHGGREEEVGTSAPELGPSGAAARRPEYNSTAGWPDDGHGATMQQGREGGREGRQEERKKVRELRWRDVPSVVTWFERRTVRRRRRDLPSVVTWFRKREVRWGDLPSVVTWRTSRLASSSGQFKDEEKMVRSGSQQHLSSKETWSETRTGSKARWSDSPSVVSWFRRREVRWRDLPSVVSWHRGRLSTPKREGEMTRSSSQQHLPSEELILLRLLARTAPHEQEQSPHDEMDPESSGDYASLSALALQCAWRSFLARREISASRSRPPLRDFEEDPASSVEQEMGVVVQCAVRSMIARRRMALMSFMETADGQAYLEEFVEFVVMDALEPAFEKTMWRTSALRVQRVFRGHTARLIVRSEIKKATHTFTHETLSSAVDAAEVHFKLMRATIDLQRFARLPLVKRELRQRRARFALETRSATQIQAVVRGNAARQRVLLWDTPKHHSVAVMLQSNWRIRMAKEAVVDEKIYWGVKKVRVVTVQCAIRSHYARQVLKTARLDRDWPPSYARSLKSASILARVQRGHAARNAVRAALFARFVIEETHNFVLNTKMASRLQRSWRCHDARSKLQDAINHNYLIILKKTKAKRQEQQADASMDGASSTAPGTPILKSSRVMSPPRTPGSRLASPLSAKDLASPSRGGTPVITDRVGTPGSLSKQVSFGDDGGFSGQRTTQVPSRGYDRWSAGDDGDGEDGEEDGLLDGAGSASIGGSFSGVRRHRVLAEDAAARTLARVWEGHCARKWIRDTWQWDYSLVLAARLRRNQLVKAALKVQRMFRIFLRNRKFIRKYRRRREERDAERRRFEENQSFRIVNLLNDYSGTWVKCTRERDRKEIRIPPDGLEVPGLGNRGEAELGGEVLPTKGRDSVCIWRVVREDTNLLVTTLILSEHCPRDRMLRVRASHGSYIIPGFEPKLGPKGTKPTMTSAIRMATRRPQAGPGDQEGEYSLWVDGSDEQPQSRSSWLSIDSSIAPPHHRDSFACRVRVISPGEGYVGCHERAIKLVWRSECVGRSAAWGVNGWKVKTVRVELLRCGSVAGGCLVAGSIRDVGNLIWTFPRGGGVRDRAGKEEGGGRGSSEGGGDCRGKGVVGRGEGKGGVEAGEGMLCSTVVEVGGRGRRGSAYSDGAWLRRATEREDEYKARCKVQATLRRLDTGELLSFGNISKFLDPEFTFRITPLTVAAPDGKVMDAGRAGATGSGSSNPFFIAPPAPLDQPSKGVNPIEGCVLRIIMPGEGFKWRSDRMLTVKFQSSWTLDTVAVYIIPPSAPPHLVTKNAAGVGVCSIRFPPGLEPGKGYSVRVVSAYNSADSALFHVEGADTKGMGQDEVVKPTKRPPPRRLAKIYASQKDGQGAGRGGRRRYREERTDGSEILAIPESIDASLQPKWNTPGGPRPVKTAPTPGPTRGPPPPSHAQTLGQKPVFRQDGPVLKSAEMAEFVDHELLSGLLVEGAADRIKKERHAAEEKERQDREEAERASLAKQSRRAQKIPRAMPAAAEKTEMWQIFTPPSKKEEEEEEGLDLEDTGWMPFVNGVPVRPPASQDHRGQQQSLQTREELLGVGPVTVVDEEERERGERQDELLGLYVDSDEEIEGETMGEALLRANRRKKPSAVSMRYKEVVREEQERNAAKLEGRMKDTFKQQMDVLRSHAPGGKASSNPSGRASSGSGATGAGGERVGLRDVWVPVCERFQRLRHTLTDEEFATSDIPLFSKAPLRLSAESMKVSTSRLDFDHARMAPVDDGEVSFIDPRVQAKVERLREERQRAAARQIEKQAAIGNIARMPSIIS